MRQNEGIADRIIRLIAGIVLLDLAGSRAFSGFWYPAIWVVALILLLTASIGFCPIYALFGFSTKAGKKAN